MKVRKQAEGHAMALVEMTGSRVAYATASQATEAGIPARPSVKVIALSISKL